MIDRSVVLRLLASFDPDAHVAEIAEGEEQRAQLIARFPRDEWPSMTLERYALGQPAHPDNFCRWMEFVARELGSIKGGSARKHLIYFQAGTGEWWFDTKLFASVDDAWQAVRQGFVDAITYAEAGDWKAIESIPALRSGPALLCKTLHTYFLDDLIPINSAGHLRHFLRGLKEPRADDPTLGTITLNRLLLEGLRAYPELGVFSTGQLERMLYSSDLSPFLPPVFTTPIPDVAGFIRDTLVEASEDRVLARRDAEDRARRLLDDHAGRMTEEQARDLFRLFNIDFSQGKRYDTRFSPAFVGATANGLVAHLASFNQWTERIWQGSEEEAKAAVAHLLADRKALPSAGISYPSVLMYLRDPESAAVWMRTTDAGLRRLTTYNPRRASPGDPEDYELFCASAAALMRDYDIPSELQDYLLTMAGNYKPYPVSPKPPSGVWLFQANPKIYAIDQALTELSELDWVVRQYAKNVHMGDRVYLWRSGPDGGVIATADVTTEPTTVEAADDTYVLDKEALSKAELRVQLRIEEVLPQPIRRVDLTSHPVLKDLGVIQFANATNFAVTPEQDQALRALIGGSAQVGVELPDASVEFAADVYVPRDWLQAEIVDLLRIKRQLIFYGPPGTGKTFVAQRVAKDLTRDGGRFELVQFHPSYSYEDFFEGYRPIQVDGGVGLSYELTPGPLRLMAQYAAADPAHPYVLVVDEINRGNVPKIFGELLFLLEYRDRQIALQYSPERLFQLPPNLFVIATMNTADRSIALVDAALRRRFLFIPFMPRDEPIRSVLRRWLDEHHLDDEPARLMDALNERISRDEISIGPSYFMTEDGSAPDLERVWKHALHPLLEEHFYGTGRDVNGEFGLAALRQATKPKLLTEGAVGDGQEGNQSPTES